MTTISWWQWARIYEQAAQNLAEPANLSEAEAAASLALRTIAEQIRAVCDEDHKP